MRSTLVLWCAALIAAGMLTPTVRAAETAPVTPEQLVEAYNSLADTILAANKTEWNLVHAILATTYGHAEAARAEATMALQSGKNAGPAIEKLAELVAQLGNEGDSSVAAIRKRLIEGGHHHNAAGEQQGVYDEGFVIVTRKSKKVFLDAGKAIGMMAGSPDASTLEKEWQKVAGEFKAMCEGAGH
jgi:hypothetical protein